MERQCWLGSCWLHCEWGKGSAFAYFDLRYCAILVRHLAIPLNATGRHFGRHWTPSIRVHLHILQLDQVHYLWIEFLSSMINGAGKNLLHTASMYGVSSRRSRENKINQWKWMPLVIFNRFYWPETIYLRCFWWLHFFSQIPQRILSKWLQGYRHVRPRQFYRKINETDQFLMRAVEAMDDQRDGVPTKQPKKKVSLKSLQEVLRTKPINIHFAVPLERSRLVVRQWAPMRNRFFDCRRQLRGSIEPRPGRRRTHRPSGIICEPSSRTGECWRARSRKRRQSTGGRPKNRRPAMKRRCRSTDTQQIKRLRVYSATNQTFIR